MERNNAVERDNITSIWKKWQPLHGTEVSALTHKNVHKHAYLFMTFSQLLIVSKFDLQSSHLWTAVG